MEGERRRGGLWSGSVAGVFERGYWKNVDEKSKEVEPLDASEGGEGVTDGIIEDGDEGEGAASGEEYARTGRLQRRWTRIVRCAVGIAQAVDGFKWVEGTRQWREWRVPSSEERFNSGKRKTECDREAEEKRRRLQQQHL